MNGMTVAIHQTIHDQRKRNCLSLMQKIAPFGLSVTSA